MSLFRRRCAGCGKHGTFPVWGEFCRSCVRSRSPASRLPIEAHPDPIRGTKYAQLWLEPDGSVTFSGTGYAADRYDVEAYAVCAQGRDHPAPHPGCECGFWVPVRQESRLAAWDPRHVALEVEVAGSVLWCSREQHAHGSPWGYRAQWQRVLSVALPSECAVSKNPYLHGGTLFSLPVHCDGSPEYLVAVTDHEQAGRQLLTACAAHGRAAASRAGHQVIGRPVSWLRERLRTEIWPGASAYGPRTAA